jgi:iron(III) transport system substrate-binding protein
VHHVRRWTALALVAALALGLSACGSDTPSSGSGTSTTSGAPAHISTVPDGNITVYSGQHEQTVSQLVGAFEAKTGVKVKVRSDDEGSLAQQLLAEGSATPADVFYAENPPALNVLDAKGLLSRTAATTLAQVPPQFNPASGNWVGVSARAVALAYNTTQLQPSELPSSILALAEPTWKGKLGIAPGETDFQPIVTTIIRLEGRAAAEAWLKGIKANSKVYADNEALIAAVNRGEVATGIVDHYYWYRMRDEVGRSKVHTALHYFAPGDAGALTDVSGAGQTTSSRHPGSAQAFLAFLVSREGQQIIADSESYEYPLASGVASTKGLRPLADFGPSPMTISQLGDGQQALQLLQQVGLL